MRSAYIGGTSLRFVSAQRPRLFTLHEQEKDGRLSKTVKENKREKAGGSGREGDREIKEKERERESLRERERDEEEIYTYNMST